MQLAARRSETERRLAARQGEATAISPTGAAEGVVVSLPKCYNTPMSKLVFRHGLSQANNRENYGTPAYGNPDASLMDEGIIHAANAGRMLRLPPYAIDPTNTIVAVSKMRRTWETANFAGFHTLRPYESLNEIGHGLTLEDKAQIKEAHILPVVALRAAEEVLKNPPEEDIWFTHGLLIASMCRVLDIYQDVDTRLIPHFCEIRELPV